MPLIQDVVVFVNNAYCNDRCRKNIRIYSELLGYKSVCFNIDELIEVTSNSKIQLISRRKISNQEMFGLVKCFRVKRHYTLEDGVGDYVKEEFNHMTTASYKFREFKAMTIKALSLFFKSIFSKYYYSLLVFNYFDFNKRALKLVINVANIENVFCDCYQGVRYKNKSAIKVIFLGSIYSKDPEVNIRYAAEIYAKVGDALSAANIESRDVVYIPHPRSSKNVVNYVKHNLEWEVIDGIILAEEAICHFDKAEVWSVGSTSQVYSLMILKRSCVVVELDGLLMHPSIHNIANYLVSIGAKNIRIEV